MLFCINLFSSTARADVIIMLQTKYIVSFTIPVVFIYFRGTHEVFTEQTGTNTNFLSNWSCFVQPTCHSRSQCHVRLHETRG